MPEATGQDPAPSAGEAGYLGPAGATTVASPTADPGATGSSPVPDGAKPGASPTPKPQADPKTPLEVVNAAMAKMEAEAKSATDGKSVVDPNAEPKPDATSVEDKDKPPPFHEHPRWKEMVAKNRDLERQVQEFIPQKQNAERYSNLNNFLLDNNISADEFKDGLNIMYLMQKDPAKAMEALQPYIEILSRQTGKVLDGDLKEKLERGLIDEDTAYKVQTDRARNQHLQKQIEVRERKDQETAESKKVQDAEKAQLESRKVIFNAVADWEKQWASTDVDYPKLIPLVRDRVMRLMQENKPDTPEKAVTLAKQAMTEIKEEARKLQQVKAPITPIHQTGKTNQRPVTTPKSSMDVVNNALAASR